MIVEKILTATSPASAQTAASAELAGLAAYDAFTVDADLVGATGGTLDVIVQRFAGGQWRDWLRFAQLASGAAAVHYSYVPTLGDTLTAVGVGTTPVISAGTVTSGHPGNKIRLLFIAGASTSAGAVTTLTLTCMRH